MMANKIQYFIRSIYKSNREKFVNNKKKYNMMIVKTNNRNIMYKRHFSSSSHIPEPNGGPHMGAVFLLGIVLLSQQYKRK